MDEDEDIETVITDLAHRSITRAMAAAAGRESDAAELMADDIAKAVDKWGLDAVRRQMLFAVNDAYGTALSLAADRLGVTRQELWRDALAYIAKGET